MTETCNLNKFIEACKNGNIEIVKSIINLDNDKIDIHFNNDRAFRWACAKGHIEIVKLLLS